MLVVRPQTDFSIFAFPVPITFQPRGGTALSIARALKFMPTAEDAAGELFQKTTIFYLPVLLLGDTRPRIGDSLTDELGEHYVVRSWDFRVWKTQYRLTCQRAA